MKILGIRYPLGNDRLTLIKFFKKVNRKIVSEFMKALGKDKLTEKTWKKIANLNRDILDN